LAREVVGVFDEDSVPLDDNEFNGFVLAMVLMALLSVEARGEIQFSDAVIWRSAKGAPNRAETARKRASA
jgi:hypothetical protein